MAAAAAVAAAVAMAVMSPPPLTRWEGKIYTAPAAETAADAKSGPLKWRRDSLGVKDDFLSHVGHVERRRRATGAMVLLSYPPPDGRTGCRRGVRGKPGEGCQRAHYKNGLTFVLVRMSASISSNTRSSKGGEILWVHFVLAQSLNFCGSIAREVIRLSYSFRLY